MLEQEFRRPSPTLYFDHRGEKRSFHHAASQNEGHLCALQGLERSHYGSDIAVPLLYICCSNRFHIMPTQAITRIVAGFT